MNQKTEHIKLMNVINFENEKYKNLSNKKVKNKTIDN